MVQPLVMVLVSLLGAYFFSYILKRIGIPSAVGQIGMGIILGLSLIHI